MVDNHIFLTDNFVIVVAPGVTGNLACYRTASDSDRPLLVQRVRVRKRPGRYRSRFCNGLPANTGSRDYVLMRRVIIQSDDHH